jgi:hypothetical protein
MHWVMLIILVMHAVAPHGGWRSEIASALLKAQVQDLAPPDADAVLGFICGSGEAGRKTLPMHGHDCSACQMPVMPMVVWLFGLLLAAGLSSLQPVAHDPSPPGPEVGYALPWPNAPPASHA